ncbi:hypothetical protein [Nocardiopsis lambiniae]|uniref:Uncharacterized protein n=1 Tax=Nocardiopsis lambiniae TaxID=3075539 RepID=A0ABU2MAZ5_9ACTN|nr:hypothetical protein [Nocardiopsis sp. DSM 44743]MDT0329852.1 hypothetical protein [Nocardiopsis sp. DSM 44743]
MFTAHGIASAHGARSVVCPAPVRRALLLAALVAGVLCALWLAGAEPAGAAEGPGADVTVPVGVVDPRHGAAVAELGRPLTETVSTVGAEVERTRAVLEESTAATPQAPAGTEDVARHLDEAVRQVVTAPIAEVPIAGPSEVVPPDTAVETVPSAERDDVPAPERVADSGATGITEVAPDVPVVRVTAVPPFVEGDTPVRTADAGGTVASAPLGVTGGTTSAASAAPSGVAQGGAFFAGYLPASAAPAPAPGLVQAAWHVLRSVPAEDADEPTFSPD